MIIHSKGLELESFEHDEAIKVSFRFFIHFYINHFFTEAIYYEEV